MHIYHILQTKSLLGYSEHSGESSKYFGLVDMEASSNPNKMCDLVMLFVEAIPQVYIHRLYQSKHLCHVGIVIISRLSQCLERRITGPWMCIGKVRSNKIQTPRQTRSAENSVASTQRPSGDFLSELKLMIPRVSTLPMLPKHTKSMSVLLFRFQVRCGDVGNEWK